MSVFAAREHEQVVLSGWRERTTEGPFLVVLTGAGGVGKTSLAVRWLRSLEEFHPDGSLFVDLGGGRSQPASPNGVMEYFLISLGADGGKISSDSEQRSALFRSLTYSRRMCVLLDNAGVCCTIL